MGSAPGDSGADEKLLTIEAEVARLTSLVTQLAAQNGVRYDGMRPAVEPRPLAPTVAAPTPISFDRARARMVRKIIQHRRMRERQFDACLLADPGWDMLLDLYAAHYEGQKVSVSSLCIAAAVPATTALRWIRTLEEEGHIDRSQDPHDGRRIYLALSEAARTRMDRYFDDIED
ncbi:winged helix DNA-binding protein [Sphingopyxis panaciterrae]